MADSDKEEIGTEANCPLCEKPLATATVFKTKSGHEFHKNCLGIHSKTNRECPTCKAICFTISATTPTEKKAGKVDSPGPSGTRENISAAEVGNIVAQAMHGARNEILTELSQQMAQLIQANLAACMPRNLQTPVE